MPSQSDSAPENTLVIAAVDSAMPSMTPTVVADVAITVTRYTGNRAWIISEEISMSIDTRPSAQIPPGIARRLVARPAT